LEPGERVLDIACGTAPGVVEAARLVGEYGLVLGVDYAEQMLAIAREKVGGLPQQRTEQHSHPVEIRTPASGDGHSWCLVELLQGLVRRNN